MRFILVIVKEGGEIVSNSFVVHYINQSCTYYASGLESFVCIFSFILHELDYMEGSSQKRETILSLILANKANNDCTNIVETV